MCIGLKKPYRRTANSYDETCLSSYPRSGMGKIDNAPGLQFEDSLPRSKMVSSYLCSSCAMSNDSKDF